MFAEGHGSVAYKYIGALLLYKGKHKVRTEQTQ